MPDTILGNASTTATLLSTGDSVFSTIDSNGDSDWFRVSLTAGWGYRVWLEGADSGQGSLSDPYLTVYNSAGTVVSWSDDANGRDSFLYYVPSASGTYYLSAKQFADSATGTYLLTIDRDAPATTSSASRVNVNGIASGSVGGSNDAADWIGVALVAGTVYQFDLIGEADDGSGANSLADPLLTLRNSAGTAVMADDNAGVGLNARIYYTPATSDTYFLDVQSAGARGSYQLLVNASPVAGTLAIGGTVSDSLDFLGDLDLFQVTLVAGTSYNFALTGGTLSDPYLEVLDAFGAVLRSVDDTGSNLNPAFSYTATASGTFFLSARAAGNEGTGTYSLSASTSGGGGGGDDYGATAATAGAIAAGASRTGHIETAGDRDWFAVSLVAGQNYTFRLNGASANGLADPFLNLYSSSGALLSYNDDGGGNLNALLAYRATVSGTHYLEARAYGSQTGAYVLSTGSTAPADTTAPTVLSFSPADEATAVAVTANMALTFSEAIQRGTGNILLKNSVGTIVESFNAATSTRLVFSGTTLTLDPTANLASGTGYRVEFAAGTVRDMAGNGYAGTTSYNFTTVMSGSGGDDYAGSTATSGVLAAGGSVTGRIETVGDRDWFAVNLVSGQTYTFRLNASGSNGLSDPYLNLYSGSAALLSSNDDGGDGMNSLLSYRATLSGTHYLEARAYSNEIGGYVLSTSGTDSTAPLVTSFSPADEASSVAVGANVTLTFNEAIQRGTGTILLKNSAGTVIESFNAATSSRVSISGASLTLDPTASLANSTGYRVEFAAGTVRDLAGNSYAGTTSYNFTTVARAGGDDYAGSAATSGSVVPGGSASGRIETVDDRDWFAVNLVAGQSYTFRLNTASSNGLSDPYLNLYSSGGTLLAYNDDGGDNLNSLLAYRASVSGTHYLEARAYGSQLGDYVLSTTGAASSDTTAPVVLSFSPADEARSVSVGANVVLTFSEAVQRGTGTILLKNAAGTVIESFNAATSGRVTISGSSLTLDPTSALANGTGYRVEFAPGTVRDLAGNSYAGTTSYNFTTVGDNTAPTVVSFSPADEASSVALGSNVMLIFSEAIQRGSGTIYLKTMAGAVIEAFDAASSVRLILSGSSITVDPTASLAGGTGYRVEFEPGTVRDLAGNAYAGTTSYNFTTAAGNSSDDYAGSTATSGLLVPGGGATGIIETVGDTDWFAVNLIGGQNYTFRLDAAGSNGLGDPYVSLYDGNGRWLSSNDDGGGNLNSSLNHTIRTSGTYYLEASAFRNEVGAYVISSSGTAASDTTAPTVVNFSPADEAGAVAVGSNVELTFSEAIQRGTGTIYLKTAAGTVVEAFNAATSSRLSISGSVLTLDPTVSLANGSEYRVEFAPGSVVDLSGNWYAGTTSYNFTTVGDDTAPIVINSNPADEASSVAVGANVTLTFNEAVQRGTGTILLKNSAGTVIEAFDAATSGRVSIAGASLTLDPTASLANSTGYRVEFAAGTVRDLAGNWYAGTTSYNFTTVAGTSGDDYAGSSATLGVVAAGGSATGRIETVGDRDWFAVNLVAGQSYTFRLNAGTSNGLTDPYLKLLSSGGSLLADNDDGDNGLNSLITYTAASSGTHYLEARAYSTETGGYSLSASASTAGGGGGGGGGSGTSGFSITVNYTGNAQYRPYFTAAAERWAEIIIGDLPDVDTGQGVIDDLLIDASVGTIDGVNGTLGHATFTHLRTSNNLPVMGWMEFDEADIGSMIAAGTFGDVVLHEMGHVLGITSGMFQRVGLVSAGNLYSFTGINAVQAYDSLAPGAQSYVPIEPGGGPGTAGSHWTESVFDKELMTGYAEDRPPMPISIITVGALEDLGYTVNYAAADPYFL